MFKNNPASETIDPEQAKKEGILNQNSITNENNTKDMQNSNDLDLENIIKVKMENHQRNIGLVISIGILPHNICFCVTRHYYPNGLPPRYSPLSSQCLCVDIRSK